MIDELLIVNRLGVAFDLCFGLTDCTIVNHLSIAFKPCFDLTCDCRSFEYRLQSLLRSHLLCDC